MALRKISESVLRRLVQQRLSPVNSCLPDRRWASTESSEVRPETAQAQTMMDIGTRKMFSEEHDMFRTTARKFFNEEVIPHHDQWEKDGQVSRELWLKAGECGLLCTDAPPELGGAGGDWLMALIMIEEQAYSNCSGPGFTLHSNILLPYLLKYGTKEQLEKYIPQMVKGNWISAIAMTEPAAGSDLQGIKTHARQDGSDWILNGSKVFITNGYMADFVVVVAVTNSEAKKAAHGISLLIVDADTPGFKKGRKLKKLGLHAQDTAELFFDDVRLPSSAVLGPLHSGFYLLMSELSQERLVVGNVGVAHSEAMFEMTRDYVKQRKAFGKTIADLQTIQHKLAEMKTEICIGRVFVDHLNQIHNETGLDSVQASMAKYWASDLENRVATQCLQMHGGWGYMWEYPIAKAFVDSRVEPIYAGSNEIMKELIARPIVKD